MPGGTLVGMALGYWHDVLSDGLAVPTDRPLDDLTVELTQMLGSADPQVRDGIAYPTLATWIGRGTYDDLLPGLGDGMAAGLQVGLGEDAGPHVFRRSFSALVLAECLERDTAACVLPAETVLSWGDALAGWFVRERDLRGWVDGHGWAHAIAHGADALGSLAHSRHLSAPELTVLLDVVADRVLADEAPYAHGETDRHAQAVLAVLRRDLVPVSVVQPWLRRLGAAASTRRTPRGNPYAGTLNAEALLRSLLIHLELAEPAVPERADLLLAIIDVLRATNPHTLGPTAR